MGIKNEVVVEECKAGWWIAFAISESSFNRQRDWHLYRRTKYTLEKAKQEFLKREGGGYENSGCQRGL